MDLSSVATSLHSTLFCQITILQCTFHMKKEKKWMNLNLVRVYVFIAFIEKEINAYCDISLFSVSVLSDHSWAMNEQWTFNSFERIFWEIHKSIELHTKSQVNFLQLSFFSYGVRECGFKLLVAVVLKSNCINVKITSKASSFYVTLHSAFGFSQFIFPQ